MNRHVKAPENYKVSSNQIWVFLAGTIDNGNSVDWQTDTANWIIGNTEYGVLNPRRENWDASLEQRMDNPQFSEQVNWELRAIELSNKVIFYIAADSLSPITLLELGLCAKNDNAYVCCEPGFWRYGNVEVVCNRYGLRLWNNLTTMLEEVFL